LFLANVAEQAVRIAKETTMPAVEKRNKGRRPILSTKKHMVTAVIPFQMERTPLMIS